MIWFTTRKDHLDDGIPPSRAPSVTFNFLFNNTLRMGFGMQLIGFVGMNLVYFAYGGKGLFTYDIAGLPEASRLDEGFRGHITTFSMIYMLGSLSLMCFQVLLADDTCWARGYRSGSKILRLATFLDAISSTMQFIFYLYISKFYTERWFVHLNEGSSELVFFVFTRISHAFACFLYGLACYLLEVYHDEGAGDLHAYLNGVCFVLTGCAELMVLIFQKGMLATPLLLITLAAATLWAVYFEPEVTFVSPALQETELTNDVEHQVEKFTRLTPSSQIQLY
ncbi:hypothetical protein BBOV_III008950 [Babesia bovis T2Bo]|uniref:Glideosome associated protein with multiple membrane spans 3 n=1 Tax=Babesia bovis TaxID=5865 RepID=A7APG8_BABBO|nr:hypothetical protein BBOV_III008950 [Babesia bovis T2Bo]EDO08452.1 hypothetical protein BBOV_III008950 [Babesia bovis T2Bo]BAN64240.1 conserved hypothetical protein [Babesia bovis]|eukprot:XP_001612020.1 hypothetical protein [Babesia bovis T2Bo]